MPLPRKHALPGPSHVKAMHYMFIFPEWSWRTWAWVRYYGWKPNRQALSRLELPDRIELFPAAEKALNEFGGLSIATINDVCLLEPTKSRLAEAEMQVFQQLVGRRGYPLGHVDGSDYYDLVIDEIGVVYQVVEPVYALGINMRRAIHNIVSDRIDDDSYFARHGVKCITLNWPYELA